MKAEFYVIRLMTADRPCRYIKTGDTATDPLEPVAFENARKFETIDLTLLHLDRLALANIHALVHPIVKYGEQEVMEEAVADNLAKPTSNLLRSHGPKHYIVALANSFPALRGKIEICGFTPANWDIDRWVKAARPWSHSETAAAMFVAIVWNWSDAKAKRWKFDAVDALSVWDNGNRAAFIAWAKNPVWP